MSETLLQPPAHLPMIARDLWVRLAPRAHKLGVLTDSDREAFELLCMTYARARSAAEILDAEGLTAEGSTGQTVQHPMIAAETRYISEMRALLVQFGLTPVARGRVEIPADDTPTDDKLAEFLGSAPTGDGTSPN